MDDRPQTTQKHDDWPHLDEKGNVVRGEYWAPAEPVPFYVDIRPFWLKICHWFLVKFCGKDADMLEAPYWVPESEAGKRKKRE